MNPERWREIKSILEAALEIAPTSRAAFLEKFCAGDTGLRREVESLLDFANTNSDTLEQDAFSAIIRNNGGKNPVGEQIGNYKIIGELGAGGMGAVFLAERADGEFRQKVAVKLIKRGMDTDAILRRFHNERQISADLNHPHITRLLDGGTTADGLPYFVMEYVEGQPLDEYCDARQLSTTKRLNLFLDVCSAISYAHQRSIIHRDLKPSNILVTTDGTVKLLDFGIAKILRSDAAQTTEITETLFRAMTPEYASPEQIKGERVTAASDVYSLGVVLYELLTGHSPYQLKSRHSGEIAKIVCEQTPERPSTAVSRAAKTSAKAKNRTTRGNRRQTCDGATEELRRRLRGDLDNITLTALAKEPADRYASVEEFSEDIRRHLEGLPVMARKESIIYKSSKLFQRHFVNNWRSALVPLTVSVFLAAIGLGLSVYWMRTKAESVAPAAAENKKTSRHETVAQAAHEAYLKGRFLWNKRTDPDVEKAIELFNQAVTTEPNYAEAYAAIAEAYVVLAMAQPKDVRREMIEKARAAALRAIEIDETLAEPHVSLAFIAYDYDWNWAEAEKEYRRAIELNPNYPTAHHWFAYLLQNIGRHDEALAEIYRARELDPLSSPIARDVAEILHHARRSDEAIEHLRKRIELDENDTRSRTMLAVILRQQGRYQESIDESLNLINKTNRNPGELNVLAVTYLTIGRKAEAQKLFLEAQQRGSKKLPLEFYLALCKKDKIFERLEDRYDSRDGIITNLKVNPLFDCIRSDPRYEDMIRRIGLP